MLPDIENPENPDSWASPVEIAWHRKRTRPFVLIWPMRTRTSNVAASPTWLATDAICFEKTIVLSQMTSTVASTRWDESSSNFSSSGCSTLRQNISRVRRSSSPFILMLVFICLTLCRKSGCCQRIVGSSGRLKVWGHRRVPLLACQQCGNRRCLPVSNRTSKTFDTQFLPPILGQQGCLAGV